MILTRTPLRISLVGGGTDLPSFYRNYGVGAVVSFTINKYVFISVNPKFDGAIRLAYSRVEDTNDVRQLLHDIARETLTLLKLRGVEIASQADIPGEGTGLGSSSSFAVGLVNALNQHKILYYGADKDTMAMDLAETACHVEIDRCKKPIGKQDQYAAAYGGMNYFEFKEDETVTIQRLPLSDAYQRTLESHSLLFYTGITRSSTPILKEQGSNLHSNRRAVDLSIQMATLAGQLKDSIQKEEVSEVGELLHENWMRKKELSGGITTPEIDEWYSKARNRGAWGAKITGAGGGGFFYVFAHPDRHKAIKDGLGLRHVPFRITKTGSRVVYMEGFTEND